MLGRSAVVSDTGRRRRRNEDQYVCVPPLFAVADGMGGAQAGEVASGLAAAVLNEADGDDFASAQHARFESRRDGLWVEDIDSTNGTFVNGARVTTPRRLSKGDVVRVGQTDFKVEV